ncbi:MAG: 50S ribosomal protein L34e [Euryarchaeota archaeon]|nr:50S ribosomal protein L34e [Euryarchaeota archaeon]
MKPSRRSRSLKRVAKRTPGGRLVFHFRKKRPGYAKCAICKRELHGLPRGRSSEVRRLPRSRRRVSRPYGGYLCSSCMRAEIKRLVRESLSGTAETARPQAGGEG